MHRNTGFFLNPSVIKFSVIYIKIEFLLKKLEVQLGDFKASGMEKGASEYAALSDF